MSRARRRLITVPLTLALVALLIPVTPVAAATYRNHVARVPETPNSLQSVRVWMESDTALGETAGLEYNVGNTYVKVLGTFDTSYPGANWRADIPAQPNGTQVRYQLFTRNQSGQDYGFSGFNWSYTVSDGDIQWDGLKHDTFDPYYRSPFGAVAAGTSVTLRFRTHRNDLNAVRLVAYQYQPSTNSTSAPTESPLVYLEDRVESGTTYAIWTTTITAPSTPAILYYKFKVTDVLDEDWYSDAYADDHDNLNQGGTGSASDAEPFGAFQLTVHDASFTTPAWLHAANVVQIFPDRFRNGDPTNDYCRPGSTTGCPAFYGGPAEGGQNAVGVDEWNTGVCDPRDTAGGCVNGYGNRFYGGDLKGIEDKLGYLQEAGFDTVYVTPIFAGRSNHRYDTDDYLTVDAALGGDAAFASLVTAMERRGMKLIVDGVFNHTSSDSRYFDRYHRYGSAGACESLTSEYRDWFEFHNEDVPCGSGDYEGWFGYESLAVLEDASAEVRDFIYRNSAQNVVQHWYLRGVDGWRFDVADEMSHDWWRDFRPYAKQDKADGPLVGEVWYDASRFLLGEQLDSVMNYRFRKNLLGFLRSTVDWGDNDNNGSNRIIPLTPSQFDAALRSVRQDYPEQATRAMLNLLGSHDTNRALYVLTRTGDTGLTEAKERLRLAALFQYTYLGAPMTYYGDEIAIDAPSVANGSNGPEDDPYNRAPYPWADEAGDTDVYGPADNATRIHYAKLGALRQEHAMLRTGAFTTLLTGDTTPSSSDNGTFAFARTLASQSAIVALNSGAANDTAAIPVSGQFADGTVLEDAVGGESYTVSGGVVSVPLQPRSGAILLLAGDADPDTAKPTATVDPEPDPSGGYVRTSPVDVTLTGTDDAGGSGIAELRYWVDGGVTQVHDGSTRTIQVSGQGEHTVAMRAIDNAGNASDEASITFTIDSVDPLVDLVSPASGSTTTDATPTVSGTAEEGSSVEVRFGSTSIGSDTVGAGGSWSVTASTPLVDGTYTVTATATDAAGNTGSDSHTNVTIDSATTVEITAPAAGSTSRDSTPTASGTAEPGASVAVSYGGTEIGTDTADGEGDWSVTATTPVADGTYTVTATATDTAGNTSSDSNANVTIDTVATAAITSPPEDSTISDTTPVIEGTADPGSSVTVKVGATTIGMTTADTNGAWAVTVSTPLGEGGHTATADATDPAGNTASDSNTFTIDSQISVAFLAPADGSTTNDRTPTFSGTAEPGATVTVRIGTTTVGSDVAASGGAWSVTGTTDLADDTYTATATASDRAGNSAADSNEFTVDTALAVAIGSPAVNSADNDSTPTVSGTADPGATVTVSYGTTEIGDDTADMNGDWTVTATSALGDGTYTVSAVATDAAGNTASDSVANVTIDTAIAVDITSPADGSTTSDTTPLISGTAEAGVTVTVTIDSGTPATTTAAGNGTWSYQAGTLAQGAHRVTVSVEDAAGNTADDSHAFTVDTDVSVAVTSPTDGSATDDSTPTFAGTAEPGSTVTVTIGGDTVGSATAAQNGSWSVPAPDPLPDGTATATATAVDGVGNSATDTTTFTVDTVAPTISGAPDRPANSHGWYRADVTITFTCEDSGSGVGDCSIDDGATMSAAASSSTASVTLGEGADQSVSATVTDRAGNRASATVSNIDVDTTAPTISGAPGRAPDRNGWYRRAVTIRFACSDALSGVSGCGPNVVLSTHGADQSAIGNAADRAGNTATDAVTDIDLDLVPPHMAVTGVRKGAIYVKGKAPAPGCVTSDATSGVERRATLSVTGGNGDGTGVFTAYCRDAMDRAGNPRVSVSATYVIRPERYPFAWVSPTRTRPEQNTIPSGEVFQARFSLGGFYGYDLFAMGRWPKSQRYDCSTRALIDGTQWSTHPFEHQGLTYDAASKTYRYGWKTRYAWAGTCRQLQFALHDGTNRATDVRFPAR